MTYAARQTMDRAQIPPQLPLITAGRINLNLHRYRVLDGAALVGHFTNVKLVNDTLKDHPAAIVVDLPTQRVLYRDGQWAQ